MKLLFLNGPPGCGKDTAADWLAERHWRRMKFAQPLKQAAGLLLDLPVHLIETKKELVLPFEHKTIRDVLIGLSENIVKPAMGQEHFGKLAGKSVEAAFRTTYYNKFVFSDSGFWPELRGCLNYLNDEGYEFQYEVWKIVRPGCDFSNDSRGYLPEGIKIDNDGTLEEFKAKVLKEIEEW
jgi:hypothetical protein